MADGVRATQLAYRLAKMFVQQNPNHPAAKAWLAGEQREQGLIKSRQGEMNAALGNAKNQMNPPAKQVNPRTKRTRNK